MTDTSYSQKQRKLFDHIENQSMEDTSISSIVDITPDYVNDNRKTLTAVSFVPSSLHDTIQSKIINPLKQADNRHYFYKPASLHLTIQNVRTINNPPSFTEKDIQTARRVFQKVVPNHQAITFNLNGLFQLPTSIAIRAYCGESLKDLVHDLREALKRAGIPDDKQYASDDVFFGNITICRYTSPPNKELLSKIKQLKEEPIGRFTVKEISLITTNAGAHPSKTKIIDTYQLN